MSEDGNKPIPEEAENDFPPPRRPLRPLMLIGLLILVALVVAGSVFAMHPGTGGSVGSATPVPTITPGSDRFFFAETPSWGTLSIDGRMLATVPTQASGLPPLRLSPGVHLVVWHADPFLSQHCAIYIPTRYTGDSCFANNATPIYHGSNSSQLAAYLITFSASLADLSVDQFNALMQATQVALGSLQGTETVQAGEHFMHTHIVDAHAKTAIETATSVLHATLHFGLDFSSSASGPCIAGNVIDQPDTCMNNGQNCFTFCLFTASEAKILKQWEVLAVVIPFWNYVTANGQTVVQDQPDPMGGDGSWTDFLAALAISWDGSQWHVTLAHPKELANTAIANPACDAAQYIIGQDSTFSSIAGSSQPLSWKYASDANAASGCLAEAFPVATTTGTPSPATAKPLARCLYRFGVLLALDDVAHRSWPSLPLASAYEQNTAQLISLQAHNS
ncbi:MAG: hypothetical protein ACRDIV_06575 [Ktedonobacteraceae bacterium]